MKCNSSAVVVSRAGRSDAELATGRRPSERCLRVVMYHYIRDLPRSRFPRIRGLLTDDFRIQFATLCGQYEMATLESALAFLDGTYEPPRDLCLLTFDDGLKEHLTDVTPLLAERGVQGLFFLITRCLEEGHVADVHQNHFLMAELGFAAYQQLFRERLRDLHPSWECGDCRAGAERTYRWDSPDVADFKYLFNFLLPTTMRADVLESVFAETLGDPTEFARELYVTWEEARSMQSSGMLLGGHSHHHFPLAKLGNADQGQDFESCTSLLRANVERQERWPFSYPYGKPGDSVDELTMRLTEEHGYCCGFVTTVGDNSPGQDRWAVQRVDTKDVRVGASSFDPRL